MGNNIVVVKFGGSCLSDSDNVRVAAEKIGKEVAKGKKAVVVVSALSGVTDQLLSLARESTGKRASEEELDDIAAMGERTVVRLMSATLNAQGVKTLGIDPSHSLWPIMTDSNFGNAEVYLEETRKRVTDNLLPLLENGYSLVIAGFIGKSPEGKITTLGRGGSDITAVLRTVASRASLTPPPSAAAGVYVRTTRRVRTRRPGSPAGRSGSARCWPP